MTGKKNRFHSPDFKKTVVMSILNGEESTMSIAKQYDLSGGLVSTWVTKYLNLGDDGLIRKRRSNSPYIGFHLRKNVSEVEQLRYENFNLKVENVKLKKRLEIQKKEV